MMGTAMTSGSSYGWCCLTCSARPGTRLLWVLIMSKSSWSFVTLPSQKYTLCRPGMMLTQAASFWWMIDPARWSATSCEGTVTYTCMCGGCEPHGLTGLTICNAIRARMQRQATHHTGKMRCLRGYPTHACTSTDWRLVHTQSCMAVHQQVVVSNSTMLCRECIAPV